MKIHSTPSAIAEWEASGYTAWERGQFTERSVNVLADRHHAGLYHSLQMLGDRLGWALYTPVGHEWWDEWYWSFGRSHWGDDRLARQFLATDQPDADPEFPRRLIPTVTLAEAKAMDWGVVIATVEDNQAGLAKFAREVGAKFVVHVGNTNQQIDWGRDPIVLNASEMPGGVHIGEEFDSEGEFAYHQPLQSIHTQRRQFYPDDPITRIGSFVNCMTSIACYPLLQQAQALLPDVHWIVGGIDGPDGVIKPIGNLAAYMQDCDWAWHDKEHGDGYGHVLHYWAAIGRPLIGHASHYAGKNGYVFWRDLETCIDLDKHTLPEAVELIREISADPPRHEAMCKAIRRVFDETTDWAGDAERVRQALAVPVTA